MLRYKQQEIQCFGLIKNPWKPLFSQLSLDIIIKNRPSLFQ
jgi:hypothetical protein